MTDLSLWPVHSALSIFYLNRLVAFDRLLGQGTYAHEAIQTKHRLCIPSRQRDGWGSVCACLPGTDTDPNTAAVCVTQQFLAVQRSSSSDG